MDYWIQKRSKRRAVPEYLRTPRGGEGILGLNLILMIRSLLLPVLTLDRDDFNLGIDFLLQHAFDGH